MDQAQVPDSLKDLEQNNSRYSLSDTNDDNTSQTSTPARCEFTVDVEIFAVASAKNFERQSLLLALVLAVEVDKTLKEKKSNDHVKRGNWNFGRSSREFALEIGVRGKAARLMGMGEALWRNRGKCPHYKLQCGCYVEGGSLGNAALKVIVSQECDN
ncbi:hypothetical protein SELMODRAFT_417650 [Selaginella moellendorffii]|uniref:Uncharacterized protein n=1 Tax=Selaginella moellendorffii TaxID=88036 RepID=D8S350_SELML|nr:hypothetical protein SELMODRAFT_417650 [Selaginella moellendorffii]